MSKGVGGTSRPCSSASPPALSSVDAAGRIRTINCAASRLLALPSSLAGQSAAPPLVDPELRPLANLIEQPSASSDAVRPHEITLVRKGASCTWR